MGIAIMHSSCAFSHQIDLIKLHHALFRTLSKLFFSLHQHSVFLNITKTILNIYDPLSVLPNGSRTLETLPRLLFGKWSLGGSGDP
jgi:hypothetical protein